MKSSSLFLVVQFVLFCCTYWIQEVQSTAVQQRILPRWKGKVEKSDKHKHYKFVSGDCKRVTAGIKVIQKMGALKEARRQKNIFVRPSEDRRFFKFSLFYDRSAGRFIVHAH